MPVFDSWCGQWEETGKLKGEWLFLLPVLDSVGDSCAEAPCQYGPTSTAKRVVGHGQEESSSSLDPKSPLGPC